MSQIKKHMFFADVDFTMIEKRMVDPPYKPRLKEETDGIHFDQQLNELPIDEDSTFSSDKRALIHFRERNDSFSGFSFCVEETLNESDEMKSLECRGK